MHDLINLNKFLTKSIGFEDIFSRFFELQDFNGGHPFYNIKRIKDDKYVLEMALAGYTKSDVKVKVDGVLSISGTINDGVLKGISKRAFALSIGTGAKLEENVKESARRRLYSHFEVYFKASIC